MKNQLDQNPGDVTNQNQEENTGITNQEEIKAEQLPAENQEESSKKRKSRTRAKSSEEKQPEPVKESRKRKKSDPSDDLVSAPSTPELPETGIESPDQKEEIPEIFTPPSLAIAETLNSLADPDALEDETEEEDEETETDSNGGIIHLNRQELVELLEDMVKQDDINAIRKKIALIKVTFLKLNKEEQHKIYEEYLASGQEKADFETPQDELEKRYNEAFTIYRDKRQVFLENQEELKHKNLEAKKIILEELKSLIDSEESLKKTYDEFKTLQEKWKEIGMVPKNEVNNLWQSYHFLVEKFFDKVKINKELRDLDLRKNLESKIELCEKTEELLLESSILKSFKQLQKYHQLWKEIGPVPQDKKDDIWERFKNATDKINQRRREHYEKLQEIHESNLAAKNALSEKAEEILHVENNSIKDWQNSTEQITELLKVWKTIGPAPRKQNEEIWEKFKSTLNSFFNGKKEYFQKIKDEQMHNYNLKLDLCVQAEAMKTSTDWRKTTQELIRLQNDWRNIGPVPRKLSDKIWKRFRGACDEFFNSKSEYFTNIGKNESDNKQLKEDLIKKVEEFEFGEDKAANLEILKGFQREWTTIGHVPIKDKERIQNEFRAVINKQLDKLKISKTEIQNINYRSRIEGMKETENPERMMSSERSQLMIRKKKIEEEIKLWENNIGFFSHSKKSSQLKEEFERKIESAKEEVTALNDKIKLLDKEMK